MLTTEEHFDRMSTDCLTFTQTRYHMTWTGAAGQRLSVTSPHQLCVNEACFI